MIAPNHDRCLQLSLLHHIVHREAKFRALAITKPANSRRQSLELDSLLRQLNPAPQNPVLWKKLQHKVIGQVNIRRLARQGHPAERTASFAEQRANICRYESRKVIRILHATLKRKGPDVVAIVE